MSAVQFPNLKTGLTAQHPYRRLTCYSTRLLEFLDGSEQRIPLQGSARPEWRIVLSKLDETELSRFSDLFDASQAGTRDIQLTDPMDGQEYTCNFAEPELGVESDALGSGSVEIRLVGKK